MTAPIYVTQRTAPTVLGIDGRRYREMVIRHRIAHVRDGKLVLVRLTDWQTAMDRLSVSGGAAVVTNDDAAPPMSADDYLAVVGLRAVGGAR